MRAIVGLGNPGSRYSRTRHNAGWMALGRLAARQGAAAEETRWGGALSRCHGAWLFRPLGYMNLSGPPVARLCRQGDVPPGELLVLVDDLDLPLGSLRLRAGGSSGGHRGLKSLEDALGTRDFARLRMGIGPLPPGQDARDFVLSRFADEEWADAEEMVERAADAALCWLREGLEPAMNTFNRKLRDNQGRKSDSPPAGPEHP